MELLSPSDEWAALSIEPCRMVSMCALILSQMRKRSAEIWSSGTALVDFESNNTVNVTINRRRAITPFARSDIATILSMNSMNRDSDTPNCFINVSTSCIILTTSSLVLSNAKHVAIFCRIVSHTVKHVIDGFSFCKTKKRNVISFSSLKAFLI